MEVTIYHVLIALATGTLGREIWAWLAGYRKTTAGLADQLQARDFKGSSELVRMAMAHAKEIMERDQQLNDALQVMTGNHVEVVSDLLSTKKALALAQDQLEQKQKQIEELKSAKQIARGAGNA